MIEHEGLATYFGVDPSILDHVPELLQDLDELGSDPGLVVDWLRSEGIDPKMQVLDLGCGKGAVSLAVADELGCRVFGVDAMRPFIRLARSYARARNLDHLCRFEVGDLREVAVQSGGFDAVLLVSVGVFGTPESMIRGCRQSVVSGGLIIVDDAYLKRPEPINFEGYHDLATRDETLRQLTACGDKLVRERRIPLAEIKAQNDRYNARIQVRAQELATRHPHLAEAFQAYVEKELLECSILESDVECATWMVRKR